MNTDKPWSAELLTMQQAARRMGMNYTYFIQLTNNDAELRNMICYRSNTNDKFLHPDDLDKWNAARG